MEADYESFEIACVIGGYQLIDSESYERRYRRSNGLPLAPGYYVVHWPDHIRARRFNEEALFHGPFRRRREAQAALERLRTVREAEAGFPLSWQGEPSPSRGNPVSPFRVAAWFLTAALVGLAAPPSAEATAYANSTIAFSSLVITPTSGTVQLLDEWTTESYTDAKNSLGEADPHSLSSYPGGTAATNSSVTWAASHGDANASTPPALPELSVTANANSLANVPGCDPNWASSDGHGTLTKPDRSAEGSRAEGGLWGPAGQRKRRVSSWVGLTLKRGSAMPGGSPGRLLLCWRASHTPRGTQAGSRHPSGPSRSANTKPSRATISPTWTGIGRANIGPSWAKL